MKKFDLITAISDTIGYSQKESYRIIDMVFDIMKDTLEAGEQVLVSGFGSWEVKEKKPRRGRNPQTGEDLLLAERRVVRFRMSPVLKERMNG